ncbi:MAG: DUF4864 domain-containing protein [Halomonadaceae bacterium]|nr:MAG: DUF4864 domain-containing protein [Halomonadaceae bacterium]
MGNKWVLGLLLLLPLSVQAEDYQTAVKTVIKSQIAAFAEDDAEKAFSYASREIQSLFVTAENFITIVAEDYPAVYRAGYVDFKKPVPHNGFVVQQITLRGPEGRYWQGHYTLVEEDQEWRIKGVQLKEMSRGI